MGCVLGVAPALPVGFDVLLGSLLERQRRGVVEPLLRPQIVPGLDRIDTCVELFARFARSGSTCTLQRELGAA